MRISGDKNDPGYDTFCENRASEIYLNGIRQDHVVTADDVEGFVLKEVHKDGKPVIRNDAFLTVQEKGEVEIRLRA
jgi:hypothetical protein